MAYTQDGIMGQIWIAFGQGAGTIRVSHDAAVELRRWYYNAITQDILDNQWETQGVHVLDRIRAIGSLAALKATGIGSTVISKDDVFDSATTVQMTSDTSFCPPVPDKV